MVAIDERPGGEPQQPPVSLTRRILAFAGLPFLSLVTPFLFLPILARIAGADAWLAIAVGQSVGGFAALFVALGYNTVGPTLVARASSEDRGAVLRRSVLPRLAIFLPGAVISVVIAAVIAPRSLQLEAALMALAMALSGLSSAWYMVGLGRAGLVVMYEIFPRIIATALAASALIVSGQVIWYPLLLVLASIISVTWFLLRTVGAGELLRSHPGEIRRVLRENRSAMVIEVAGGAYNSLAVSLASITASTVQAASYVSGDKLYRIGQYSVSALGNALQGWVVEGGAREFTIRAKRSLLIHLALGLLGFVAFALLGPVLSGLLFGAQVAIDEATALGFGVATICIALGTALGRVILVGLGARREFMICVLVGATVGVPSILLLAASFGAAGAAWGLALGEVASVTGQAIYAMRRWPRSNG